MSHIIVCYKWVLDEADIRVNADLSVDIGKAKGKISDYDKNAIEAAVRAAAALNGKAIGLTYGGSEAKLSIKDALSRGLDECYYLNGPEALKTDGAGTGRALAAAIKRINDVRMVICAEGASDTYARQTAPRIGALLNLPVVTSVSQISIQGELLTAKRTLDDCVQTVQVRLPAVVAVLPEINPGPIPGLKAVLAASKRPQFEMKTADLGIDLVPLSTVADIRGYVMDRKNLIFRDGDTAARGSALATALRKAGVV